MNEFCTLVKISNPFGVAGEQDASHVVPGDTIRDVVMPIIEADTSTPMTVQLNGQWLLRKSWGHKLQAGDIITVHREVQGGGDSNPIRTILQIAVVVAISYATAGWGSGAAATFGRVALTVAATAILNNLIPASQGIGVDNGSPNAGSPTYNFSLRGNRLAALGEPIPVGYGFLRSYPKFAAQPYSEYFNNDQYFNAIFIIGQGSYEVPRVEIDDTNIDHFQEVQRNLIKPGQLPILVSAGVVTAPEVTGQELLTAKVVGAFSACNRGLKAAALGFDILFLRGLGVATGSTMGPKSVTIRFDFREIDDFGVPIGIYGAWQILETVVITEATTTAVRKSFKYSLPFPMRCEVRTLRIDNKDESYQVLNEPLWGGLRAYLDATSPLAPTATYLELKIRASEQLSVFSQTQISVLRFRKIRAWTPNGWEPEIASRSIAWAIADILTNTVYGEGLPDNRVDLNTLLTYDAVWTARQDRFDCEFDTVSTAIAAANVAAKCGRAVCIPRGNVISVMRDQRQTLPVAMFTPRNMIGEGGSSFSLDTALPSRKTPDGVSLRYFSGRTWQFETVICPIPGLTAAQCVNLQQETILGIVGSKQAEREGLYLAADTFYRRMYAEWTTELDGTLPAYGSMVMVAHDLPSWGQFGDVVDWEPDTGIMTLTENPVWGDGVHWIRFQESNGTLSIAYVVTSGGPNQVTFAPGDGPDIPSILIEDAGKERTKYMFGNAIDGPVPHRVRMLDPQDRWRIRIGTVVEDDRVHTVDNLLLPGFGEIQDPVSGSYGTYDPGGGGFIYLVTLNDLVFEEVPPGNDPFSHSVGYVLFNNGIAGHYLGDTSGNIGVFTALPDQWLNVQPATQDQTILFEVKATILSYDLFVGNYVDGTFDVWLPLNATRQWAVYMMTENSMGTVQILFEIRLVSNGVVQDSAIVRLTGYRTGGGS